MILPISPSVFLTSAGAGERLPGLPRRRRPAGLRAAGFPGEVCSGRGVRGTATPLRLLPGGGIPRGDSVLGGGPLLPKLRWCPRLFPRIKSDQAGRAFSRRQTSRDLTQSEIIVAVGRGIKAPEHIELAKKLAEALGAEIGASRPICDSGWLPMDRQVGSSGQPWHLSPYVALGISGAIQHMVGMKGSRTVVAINKDKEAPIFEAATYGIVGDLFEIVPALTEEIRKIKS